MNWVFWNKEKHSTPIQSSLHLKDLDNWHKSLNPELIGGHNEGNETNQTNAR